VSVSCWKTLGLLALTRANKWAVLGVLFTLHGTLTISSLSSIPLFLLAHLVPRVTLEIWLLVYICFTLCVHFSWLRVSLIIHLVTFEADVLTD